MLGGWGQIVEIYQYKVDGGREGKGRACAASFV